MDQWEQSPVQTLDRHCLFRRVHRRMHSFAERKGDHNLTGHRGGPAIVTSYRTILCYFGRSYGLLGAVDIVNIIYFSAKMHVSVQDEKNQVMKTNVWMRMVG